MNKQAQKTYTLKKTNKTDTRKRPQRRQAVKKKEAETTQRRFDPAIFEMINPNAAGIDVASEEMWVCVPAHRAEQNVRKFGAFTDDLYAIADWLAECGITSVAMESTGVYWIPLYQVLEERGFVVCLTNARHLKNVSGRPKTDRLDCQWIQRLHSYGLLKASFRPADEICQIRTLQRHRDNLIRQASQHVQHMQKAVHQMNVLLPKVVSSMTGVTGMAIIQKILDGERNPVKLAKLRNAHCKSSQEEIAKALKGDYRAEHVFVLRQAYQAYHFVHEQLRECDRALERLVKAIDKQVDATQTPPPPQAKTPQPKAKNAHTFDSDVRTLLYECFGTDVTAIPGINETNGLVLVSELGSDVSAWETEKRFSSWLGLAPNVQSSAGKVKSSETRKMANRAAGVFRMAARAVTRSKSALGAFYRRMKARLGAPKAMTATAHKIAVIFYHLVRERTVYREAGEAEYTQQQEQRMLKRLKKQAKRLGYLLTPQEA
jgi:transposase